MENDNQSHEEKSLVDNMGHSQAVKAALHLNVGHITEDIGKSFGVTFSKPLVATLAELLNRQIEIYANDLEAFAKHARRSVINCEDVKLLARRNPKLREKVKEIADSVEASGSGVSKKRKKQNDQAKLEKDGKVAAEVTDEDLVEQIDLT